MKKTLTFVSASAGSGKTYRIAQTIEDRMRQGACRPGGLIATTYTVKAAQDLRERVRRRLYDVGLSQLAERMDEGLIGTVHSVCGQLLGRFAFEAQISPQIQVLAEDEAAVLLSKGLENVIDFVALKQIQRLADRLGQKNPRTKEYYWKGQVREILRATRANDFPLESLDHMARQSIDELVQFLSPGTGADLDPELGTALGMAIKLIGNGDGTDKTQKYLTLLRDNLRDLKAGVLPWSAWVKLAKEQPGKKNEAAAVIVASVAARFETHARLREDIRDYTTMVFSLAKKSLAEFQRLKEERGLLDFDDLEHRALRLLQEHEDVRQVVREELDLLVVDEFQDTSPIQLALFMQLASCARETVWVGDVKQAIYGFRNSDPALIRAVIAGVREFGTIAEPLGKSYRSTPELVDLTNALFVPAFDRSLGIQPDEVRLEPTRKSISPPQPAAVFLQVSSGEMTKTTGKLKRLTVEKYAATVADGVTRLLNPKELVQVEDRKSKKLRSVEPRDVSVLCRTNDAAADIANALAKRGVSVTLSRGGLLATPEVRLAIACLRRLADASDTLAAAEIVALSGELKTEDWLQQRIEHVARQRAGGMGTPGDRWGVEEPFLFPALAALESARSRLNLLSLTEALELALTAANVFATVSSWGQNATRTAQRRANLESLRALAAKYEQSCLTTHSPASVAGFLFWCDDLAGAGEDLKAADEQVNAVHVSTYHKAKGLEWPVVVCADLDAESKPRLWDVCLVPENPAKPFELARPLANRRLRFWVWPFGQQEKGVPMVDRIEASETGQAAARTAQEEDLRLLYVGLTRPRDLLALVLEEDRPAPWLEGLQAPWLNAIVVPVPLPDGGNVPAKTFEIITAEPAPAASALSDYFWFPAPVVASSKPPAHLVPSAQAPLIAAKTGRIVNFSSRLPVAGHVEESDLGDALHLILAAEFINPGHPQRKDLVKRALEAFGLASAIREEDVLDMADRFRAQIQNLFHPKAAVLVEAPFEITNGAAQRVRGFIDLMLETEEGWIIVDHKSFLGGSKEWAQKALSHSGQVAVYRQALINTGRKFAGAWIHFAPAGGIVEILLPKADA